MLELWEGLHSTLPHHAAEILQQRVPGCGTTTRSGTTRTRRLTECGTPIEQSGEAGHWRRFCGKRCRQLYHYKKWQEKRLAKYQPPVQICPNCGKDFQPEWGPGTQRRFCSDACRIQWWTDDRKANPSLEEKPLWCECCGQALRMDQKKLQPCLLSQSHGGNAPSADMRVVRGRIFGLCRGRTVALLPELCHRCSECAKEFLQRPP